MKRKVVKAFIGTVAVVAVACVIASLTGCREVSRVSYNVSQEADNYIFIGRSK